MKLPVVCFSLIIACLSSLSFAADTNAMQYRHLNWYVDGGLGLSWTPAFPLDFTYSEGNTAASYQQTTNASLGYNLFTAVGYRWNKWFRNDISLGYINNSLSTWSAVITINNNGSISTIGGSGSASGSLSTAALFFNGYLDIPVAAKISPYVGLGVGVLNTIFTSTLSAPGSTSSLLEKETVNPLAYQLIAGANYFLKPNIDIFLEYHYLQSENITNNFTFSPDNNSFSIPASISYQTNLINVGMRWYFA